MMSDDGRWLALVAIGALAIAGARSEGSLARRSPTRKKKKKKGTAKPRRSKEWIVRRARQIFTERFGVCSTVGRCPQLAWAVIEAAREGGRYLTIQAGSAYWERLPPHLDDGVSDTHFGYTWDPSHPASRASLAAGGIPEVHVWAADPKTQEIIDLATGDWPDQAAALGGYDWPGKRPPSYLWTSAPLPVEAHYEVNREATLYIAQILEADGMKLPRSGSVNRILKYDIKHTGVLSCYFSGYSTLRVPWTEGTPLPSTADLQERLYEEEEEEDAGWHWWTDPPILREDSADQPWPSVIPLDDFDCEVMHENQAFEPLFDARPTLAGIKIIDKK